jgi:hypothetical protein
VESYSGDGFFGAHVVVARATAASPRREFVGAEKAMEELTEVADFWVEAQGCIRRAADRNRGRPSAIYGASVYGSYIATRLDGSPDLRCFVDRNPHLWGPSSFGVPVVAPDELPADVGLIFAGVNPKSARGILADVPEWRGRQLEIVYLDER